MSPYSKSILKQDFLHHGEDRMVNSFIALVEPDPDADEEDEDKTMLRYVAYNEEEESVLLGKYLYGNQKCIR